MSKLLSLTKRNCTLFYKDKGMFFTSLITPAILLVLYITFLGNVYEEAFMSSMPEGVSIDEKLIGAIVGGQLISSILAVSCVTIAFCSNLLMVQDKVTGSIGDLTITPTKSSILSLSYFFATMIATLIICFTAFALCLVYLAFIGWFMTLGDILLICVDIVLLVLFGTALSSLINAPLSTSGQGSAVGTVVSSGYGFICGAYMPISNFGLGLQRVLSFFPGTYGTSLLRNHAMEGSYRELAKTFPSEVIEAIKDSIDCNLYFFDNKVDLWVMYLIVALTILLLIGLYIAINAHKSRSKKISALKANK